MLLLTPVAKPKPCRRGRDRMQTVPSTTDVSLNVDQGEVYNIM
jgi:hypothetical protein